MDWYLIALKKYAVFRGRARRKEYWAFFAVNLLIFFGLGIVESMLGIASEIDESMLGLLYSAVTFIPSIAVGVRRLHDTGRSGWWFLISLIPIIGIIALLLFLARDGQPGTNEYGPDPKQELMPA